MELSNIHFSCLAELEERLYSSGLQKPVILLNRQRAHAWGLEVTMEQMAGKGAALWLAHTPPLPTQQTVWEALQQLKGSAFDGFIAIGGGSVIDLAKILCALHQMDLADPSDVLQVIVEKAYRNDGAQIKPVIAVPSTAGTGSEVTQWATVWDMSSAKKHSVDAPYLQPKEAWIIPELTNTLPPRLTLSTGLDAACHAAEAYWAKPSTPLVKELAVRALQIITKHLGKILQNPGELTLRQEMSTGALLAGLAFSQTRTTACHSISYPITALYRVDHGLSCALTLAQVAEKNAQAVDLTDLLEVFAPFGGIQPWLGQVCSGFVTLRLSSFGIPADAIDTIVDHAFTGGRMDNNPVELSRQDVSGILQEIV